MQALRSIANRSVAVDGWGLGKGRRAKWRFGGHGWAQGRSNGSRSTILFIVELEG